MAIIQDEEEIQKWVLENESTSNMDGDYNFQESVTNGEVKITNYKEEHSEKIERVVEMLNQHPKMVKALRYAFICLDDGTDTSNYSKQLIIDAIGEFTPGVLN